MCGLAYGSPNRTCGFGCAIRTQCATTETIACWWRRYRFSDRTIHNLKSGRKSKGQSRKVELSAGSYPPTKSSSCLFILASQVGLDIFEHESIQTHQAIRQSRDT